MLLHYLVVPELGDAVGSRSQATAVHADEAAPADGDNVTVAAVPTDSADSVPPAAATPFAA